MPDPFNGKTRSRSSSSKDGGLRAVVPPLFAATLADSRLSGYMRQGKRHYPIPITEEPAGSSDRAGARRSSGSSGVLIRSVVPAELSPSPRSLVDDIDRMLSPSTLAVYRINRCRALCPHWPLLVREGLVPSRIAGRHKTGQYELDVSRFKPLRRPVLVRPRGRGGPLLQRSPRRYPGRSSSSAP